MKSEHETLRILGFTAQESSRIIEESYPTNDVAASVLSASRATRSLFTRHGVLSLPENHDAFAEKGMLYATR